MVCCGLCKTDDYGVLTTFLAADITWMWIQGFRAFFGAIWDGGWWNAFMAVVIFTGCLPPYILCIINHRKPPRDRYPKWYLIYAMKNFLMSIFSFMWMMVVFGWKWPSAGLIWMISVPFFVMGTIWAYACSGASLRVTNQGPKNRTSSMMVLPRGDDVERGGASASTVQQAPIAIVSAQPAVASSSGKSSKMSSKSRHSAGRSRRLSQKHSRYRTQEAPEQTTCGQPPTQLSYLNPVVDTLDVRQQMSPMTNNVLSKSMTSLNTEYTLGTTPGSTLSRDVSMTPLSVNTSTPAPVPSKQHNKVLHAAGTKPPKPVRRTRSKSNSRSTSTRQLNQVGLDNEESNATKRGVKSASASPTTSKRGGGEQQPSRAHATAVAMAVYGVTADNDKLLAQKKASASRVVNGHVEEYADEIVEEDTYTYEVQEPAPRRIQQPPAQQHSIARHPSTSARIDQAVTQQQQQQQQRPRVNHSNMKALKAPTFQMPTAPAPVPYVSTQAIANDIHSLIRQFEKQRIANEANRRLQSTKETASELPSKLQQQLHATQNHVEQMVHHETQSQNETSVEDECQIGRENGHNKTIYGSEESLYGLQDVHPMPPGTVLDARLLSPSATTAAVDQGASSGHQLMYNLTETEEEEEMEPPPADMRIGRRQMVKNIAVTRPAPQPPSVTVRM